MASGDFLAKIKLILEGKEQTISGLKQTQEVAQQFAKTKITPTFDKAGLATGQQIKDTFSQINDKVKQSPSLFEQMGLAMKRALVVAPVWMIIRGAIQTVTGVIREQIKFLIDLETAMTRIKIVGKGTEAEYKNLQTALVGLAYTYGITASEATAAAVIFAQQGRTVKETIELTRAAMLASKILGTDIKTAVDDMTAAIEGFQLGIGDATSIVDKWINVEKQFAVTSKDLADATKVAGASANQLGITMSEFLGDVTAVVEVTRKAGGEAARGLSFIYARLLTSGKQTIEQITKIPYYLDATGQATNVVGTQLRDVSSILGDLAIKWETLTTQEKLAIATSLGSKRQMVVLNALMQNYTASLDARIASLTSAGAAEKAFALIQDTTTTKLKQVQTAWNVLTTTIGDTSAFKDALSAMDKLILGFSSLISFEKAYGAVYSREINKTQLANETRLNEVKSIEELISVRDKLAKSPGTVENLDRLKQVQTAIDSLSAKEPKIRVALETGKPEELKKIVEDRIKALEIEKIRLTVSLEFEPKIGALEEDIKKTKIGFGFLTKSEDIKALRELVSQKEEELKKLYEDQTKTIEEQYKIQKGQVIAKQALIDGFVEEELTSTALTDAEKERLDIEKELIKFRSVGLGFAEDQIKKEIELVEQSKFLYDIHEKNLKLEELANKLLDAKLQKRQKDAETLVNVATSMLGIANEEESAIIRQAMAFQTLMHGEDYIKNSMEDRVKLAQALTKEADEQEKKSSHLVTLYTIAQRFGLDAAREVSQFIGGTKKFSQLSVDALRALRRESSILYQQGKAEEFFKYTGFRFPEKIEKERIGERNVRILNNVMIEPISINVRLESESVIYKVTQEITKLLNDKKSELSQKIQEQIESF